MASNGITDLGQFDFMNRGMYPGSQLDRSYYSSATQVPLAAQAAQADYDPAVNPLTGEPVSRFAQGGIASFAAGGSPFADDPNNFAADLTKAYKATLGRDPSTEELRANVDALNRNPDAYAFIVDQLAEDPNAAKFYAESAKPQVDEEGNEIAPSAYNPEQVAMDLKSGYGKFTPTPEQGGIAGFANKIGPYAPLLLAGGALAAPYLASMAAAEGAGALTTAELMGGAGGAFVPAAGSGASFALPAGAAYTTGAGALTAAEMAGAGGGAFTPTAGSSFAIAPEAAYTVAGPAAGSGSWGLTPELAAEFGLEGSTSGLSTSGAQGSAALEAMGLNSGASGLTAKQLAAANMGLKTLSGAVNGGSEQGSYGSASSAPAVRAPQQTYIAPTMLGQQKYGELYRPYTYDYTRRAAEGGMMYGNGGGISTLGSYSDGGQLLKGPGTGLSDDIPASIGGSQPAALADGEFVISSDVVSALGGGSTDAGAKKLYKMMDRIRHAAHGTKKQIKEIDDNKVLPA